MMLNAKKVIGRYVKQLLENWIDAAADITLPWWGQALGIYAFGYFDYLHMCVQAAHQLTGNYSNSCTRTTGAVNAGDSSLRQTDWREDSCVLYFSP